MIETRGTKTPQLGRYWECPRWYDGQTVFVIGNGPSLRSVDMARLDGRNVIAVNSAYWMARKVPSVLFFGDAKWYWLNKESLDAEPATMITLSRYWVERDGTRREEPVLNDRVHVMRQDGIGGLSGDPCGLCWNRSSGGTAIDLAVHMGAARVVLLGFDMRGDSDGLLHAYHVAGEKKEYKDKDGLHMADAGVWQRIQNAADKRGVEILNATSRTALPVVKRINMGDVL